MRKNSRKPYKIKMCKFAIHTKVLMEMWKCVERIFFHDKAKAASLRSAFQVHFTEASRQQKHSPNSFNAFPFSCLLSAHKPDGNNVIVMTFNHSWKIEGDATVTETIERIHSSQIKVQFHQHSKQPNVTFVVFFCLFLWSFQCLRCLLIQ